MTIYDIATKLKVSPATVSMALNDDTRVAERTRDRVRTYADKIGFRRNEQARNFRLKRTNTIAVVVYNIDNDFWSGVVKAIEDQMGDSYSVILCNTEESLEKEKRVIANLHQRQVDGIIIQPVPSDYSHLEAMNKAGIPVVLFEKTESEELSFVKGNDRKAARNLTLQCIDDGHKEIAFLSFKIDVIGVQDRVRGFRQACLECGIEEKSEVFIASEISEEAIAEVILNDVERFSLVICCDDRIACLLMKILNDNNIKVPEKISVTGWNNSRYLDYLVTPLTSVCIPVQDMGIEAAEIIKGYLKGNHTPVKKYVKEKIVYRQSYKTIK